MTSLPAEFEADGQANLPALQEAIRKLTRFQREELAEWMLNSPDLTDVVAELRSVYGSPSGRRRLTVAEFIQSQRGSPVRVLVAQRSPEVIVLRRGENWNHTVLTSLDDVVESRSVELSVSLEEIYAGVR